MPRSTGYVGSHGSSSPTALIIRYAKYTHTHAHAHALGCRPLRIPSHVLKPGRELECLCFSSARPSHPIRAARLSLSPETCEAADAREAAPRGLRRE